MVETSKQIAININEEQLTYLKSLGINRSSFMRQAIEAHKKSEFTYKYV